MIKTMLALYWLKMRLNAIYWANNALVVFVIPLAILWLGLRWIPPRQAARILVGITVLSSLGVVTNHVGNILTFDRIAGLRSLFLNTHITRRSYLGAHALECCTLGLLPLSLILIVRSLAGISFVLSVSWLGWYFCSIVILFAMGVISGSLFRDLLSNTLVSNAVTFFQVAFCPVLYPIARVPHLLRPIVSFLPASAIAELLTRSAQGEALTIGWTTIFFLWLLALPVLAVFKYRRSFNF